MSRILHVWRPSNIRLTHAQYARSPGHVPQSQSPWCHGSVTVMPTGNTSPSFQTTPPPLLPRMASSSSPSSSTTRLVKFTQRPRSHPPSSSTEPVCYSVHWPSLAHVVLVPPKDLHFPRSIREHLISMQPSFHAPASSRGIFPFTRFLTPPQPLLSHQYHILSHTPFQIRLPFNQPTSASLFLESHQFLDSVLISFLVFSPLNGYNVPIRFSLFPLFTSHHLPQYTRQLTCRSLSLIHQFIFSRSCPFTHPNAKHCASHPPLRLVARSCSPLHNLVLCFNALNRPCAIHLTYQLPYSRSPPHQVDHIYWVIIIFIFVSLSVLLRISAPSTLPPTLFPLNNHISFDTCGKLWHRLSNPFFSS